ncbi:MAG: hypothetical protein EBV79_13175, partial [Betaproteobacteria bacterium]|nr:hypothetical protein [Betaproteobacteria bacterium]
MNRARIHIPQAPLRGDAHQVFQGEDGIERRGLTAGNTKQHTLSCGLRIRVRKRHTAGKFKPLHVGAQQAHLFNGYSALKPPDGQQAPGQIRLQDLHGSMFQLG